MRPKLAPSSFLGVKKTYKRIPMGIADSSDVSQGKMLEQMESLEYF
jgi:hypothetical protein